MACTVGLDAVVNGCGACCLMLLYFFNMHAACHLVEQVLVSVCHACPLSAVSTEPQVSDEWLNVVVLAGKDEEGDPIASEQVQLSNTDMVSNVEHVANVLLIMRRLQTRTAMMKRINADAARKMVNVSV